MNLNKRVTFSTDEDFLNEINLYVARNKNKYRDRTDFMNVAVKKLMDDDNEFNTREQIKILEKQIKHLKKMIELNLQFTYSMMERQELKVSNLYYGDSLRAMKGKEAIDGHYRNKLMNENKIQTKNNVVEENKNKNRITIDDL